MSQEPSPRITITQFPDELIDNIFALYQMDYHPDRPRPPLGTFNPNGFPWDVARVCRAWRNIALSDSRFWSIIDLRINDCYDAQGRLFVQVKPVIQLMLERSSPAPLTINFEEASLPGWSRLADDIMVLLVQHSERWADARFRISDYLFNALDGVRNRLPILSKLVLDPSGLHAFDEFDAFKVAPRLESVTLDLVVNSTELYRFPTQQIKVLHGPTSYQLAEQCPLLEDCEIEFSLSTVLESARDPTLSSFVKPKLHRLVTNSVISTLGFQVRALTTLVVSSYNKDIRNNIHDLIRFIEWNQCPLQRLSISGYFTWDLDMEDQDPIHRLLKLVTQLNYLRIAVTDLHGTLWDRLAHHLVVPDDSTEPLVPHLNEIYFWGNNDLGQDTKKKLGDMIISRCRYCKGRFRSRLSGSLRVISMT